jgi:hypothetical protein
MFSFSFRRNFRTTSRGRIRTRSLARPTKSFSIKKNVSSQPIRIKNSDPVGHNTSLKPKKNPAYDQTIPSNAAGLYQPKAEEDQPFPVACAIHPWMKAYMITRKNSYFAVTKPDGSFEIPNLPAGVELEFRVWQERTNFMQEVTVNGASEKWAKGRFKRTLAAGEKMNLEVQVPGSLF